MLAAFCSILVHSKPAIAASHLSVPLLHTMATQVIPHLSQLLCRRRFTTAIRATCAMLGPALAVRLVAPLFAASAGLAPAELLLDIPQQVAVLAAVVTPKVGSQSLHKRSYLGEDSCSAWYKPRKG